VALKASIDIGTNSTRLLIVDRQADRLETIEQHERITKLGAGMSPQGDLAPDSMDRVMAALSDYHRVTDDYAIDDIRLFATSATRDARNREFFLNLIMEKTGWACRVLSGDEEARLSFLGVVSDLDHADNFFVCDVGGGSTELVFVYHKTVQSVQSMDIGSSRMTKQFLISDPPAIKEIDALNNFITEQLDIHVKSMPSVQDMVAVGGTAVTLALVDAKTSMQNTFKAHHYRLNRASLQRLIFDLSRSSLKERTAVIGLHPMRADVIVAGALILSQLLDFFRCESMLISLRDLLFGIFLEERLKENEKTFDHNHKR
jgi:exopolyphosphatase/guanosine-5'-triphosphate,3'-diphosphate pyrophosphatase